MFESFKSRALMRPAGRSGLGGLGSRGFRVWGFRVLGFRGLGFRVGGIIIQHPRTESRLYTSTVVFPFVIIVPSIKR